MIAIVIVTTLFMWSMVVAFLLRCRRRHINIAVTHMNRISASILEHNKEAIKDFLSKSGKANFVLPNGCIIVSTKHGNICRLFMLENLPSDAKRFVSSSEFNDLGLVVPYTKGPSVRIYVRHGQAFHNLTAPELRGLWDGMNDTNRTKYRTHAMNRISTKTWWSLSEERQMTLTLQELRYDAPLTEKGREEAVQASKQLMAYIQEHYPHACVCIHASELLRAYETGAMLLSTWTKNECSFSFDTVVYTSHQCLNEMHREIGSVVHMLGTPGRRVAESLDLDWKIYASYILKTPLSFEAIAAMTYEEQKEVRDKVVYITSENNPMPREQRPLVLHDITIHHHNVDSAKKTEYDLFMNF